MNEPKVRISELKAEYSNHKTMHIKDWDKVVVQGTEDWGYFLYSSPMQSDGFEAVFVQCMCRTMGEPVEETEVEVVFHVAAFYDGARHIWFNAHDKEEGCAGYIYYPDLKAIVKGLELVDDMQKKYCSMYEE